MGNAKQVGQKLETFLEIVNDAIKQDYEFVNGNKDILLQRGHGELTTKEMVFYEKWIRNVKSNNPKQNFTDLLDGVYPEKKQ